MWLNDMAQPGCWSGVLEPQTGNEVIFTVLLGLGVYLLVGCRLYKTL